MITITGNTYPVRQALRDLGGLWNPQLRGWDMPDAKAEEARAIVAAAGPARVRSSGFRRSDRPVSTYTRFNSGGEQYTNRNGRCIDAPCCGCCS